mgnify:CR=1 FL=1
MEKGPGQPQPLPFSPREGAAQFSDLGVISLGQALDQIMHRGLPASVLQFLLGGIQFGNAEVPANAVVKEVGFLGDKTLHFSEILGVDAVHIGVGQGDLSLLGLPKPHKQFQ